MSEVVFHLQDRSERSERIYGLPLRGTCGGAGLRVGDVFTELVWHVILPGDFFSRHREVVRGEVAEVQLVIEEIEAYSTGPDGRTRFETVPSLPSAGYCGVRLAGPGTERLAALDLVADRGQHSKVWSLRGQRTT
jgi:hypothetical protein